MKQLKMCAIILLLVSLISGCEIVENTLQTGVDSVSRVVGKDAIDHVRYTDYDADRHITYADIIENYMNDCSWREFAEANMHRIIVEASGKSNYENGEKVTVQFSYPINVIRVDDIDENTEFSCYYVGFGEQSYDQEWALDEMYKAYLKKYELSQSTPVSGNSNQGTYSESYAAGGMDQNYSELSDFTYNELYLYAGRYDEINSVAENSVMSVSIYSSFDDGNIVGNIDMTFNMNGQYNEYLMYIADEMFGNGVYSCYIKSDGQFYSYVRFYNDSGNFYAEFIDAETNMPAFNYVMTEQFIS